MRRLADQPAACGSGSDLSPRPGPAAHTLLPPPLVIAGGAPFKPEELKPGAC